jgi:hypothetical protein
MTATLEQFRHALATVAEIGATVASQEQALAQDEAAVLEQLIANIKPVMRYIDRPIRAAGSVAGNQFAHWVYTDMPERGITLAGAGLEENHDSGDQNRGDYEGNDLVLGRSGTLYYRTFAGSWSRWQGEAESWTTTANDPGEYGDVEYDGYGSYAPREGSTVDVTPLEALSHYDLVDIVSSIISAINQAIAASEAKQRTLASRLERLQAVKAALGS